MNGGELASLLDALKGQEQRRQELRTKLTALTAPRPEWKPHAVRQRLESYLLDWRGLLRANVQQGQQVLKRLIEGRLTFTPREDYYEFHGTGTIQPLISGVVQVVQDVASPTGLDTLWIGDSRGTVKAA